MNDDQWLQQEWERLRRQAGLDEGGESIGRELLHRYAEPHRVYHTAEHLRQLLAVLGELKASPSILLAAWFHDAVYEPGRTDNESRSADLARGRLKACGYPAADTEAVCEAILATANHESTNAEPALLLDADLSVLGAAPEDYRRYCEGIRREFAVIPPAAFAVGRATFLRRLLSLPAIFKTVDCRRRLEEQARRNLRGELQQLESQIEGGCACD